MAQQQKLVTTIKRYEDPAPKTHPLARQMIANFIHLYMFQLRKV